MSKVMSLAELLRRYEIVGQDVGRQWGEFYLIHRKCIPQLITEFFPQEEIPVEGEISPKFLVVKPGQRLSWQYHNRRKEIWHVISGPVGVMRSFSDELPEMIVYKPGDIITIEVTERHRLIGLEQRAIIAELWCHTDPENHSDEQDIVRLQDDYGR